VVPDETVDYGGFLGNPTARHTPQGGLSGSGGDNASVSPSRGAGGNGGSPGTVVPDETVDYGAYTGDPPAAVATDSPGGSTLPRSAFSERSPAAATLSLGLPRSAFSERSPAAAALVPAMAAERNRPNLPELDHVNGVDFEGKELQRSDDPQYPWVWPPLRLNPEDAYLQFVTQDRDRNADNDTNLTGAPAKGPAYRVTGYGADAFGKPLMFEGYMVDMPGGFSWLSLEAQRADGRVQMRFMGYISDDGLIHGHMWSFYYDDSGKWVDWAYTSETQQLGL
jgi:hypothetical protein